MLASMRVIAYDTRMDPLIHIMAIIVHDLRRVAARTGTAAPDHRDDLVLLAARAESVLDRIMLRAGAYAPAPAQGWNTHDAVTVAAAILTRARVAVGRAQGDPLAIGGDRRTVRRLVEWVVDDLIASHAPTNVLVSLDDASRDAPALRLTWWEQTSVPHWDHHRDCHDLAALLGLTLPPPVALPDGGWQVTIPLPPPAVHWPLQGSAGPSPLLAGWHALLVSADPPAPSLRAALTALGATPIPVPTIAAALDRYTRTIPTLVVLLTIPDRDHLNLLLSLRAAAPLSVLVIADTAAGLGSQAAHAAAAPTWADRPAWADRRGAIPTMNTRAPDPVALVTTLSTTIRALMRTDAAPDPSAPAPAP